MIKIGCIGECMLELSQFDPKTDKFHVAVAGDTLTAPYLSKLLPANAAIHAAHCVTVRKEAGCGNTLRPI